MSILEKTKLQSSIQNRKCVCRSETKYNSDNDKMKIGIKFTDRYKERHKDAKEQTHVYIIDMKRTKTVTMMEK